jgi:hypothetical protein
VGAAAGQAVWPAEQLWLHTPDEHFWPAPQTFPQVPQLFGSVWVLVQNAVAPEPQALGVAAGQPHTPPVQTCPAAHTTLHPPQLLGSLVVVAQ